MKINLGIDLGVQYDGWALTDENYNVVKVNGKNAIGVLEFQEGQTADKRRQYRTARRRIDRRRYRLALLHEIFDPELMKVDKNFSARLFENDLIIGDRTVPGKYSLFNDADFNDIKYYAKYPTIYHLRKALMEKAPDDIRLLYLAVHHIVKYRGHFLQDGETKSDENSDILDTFNRLNACFEARNEEMADDDLDAKEYRAFDLSKINEVENVVSGIGEITARILAEKKETLDEKYRDRAYVTKKDKKEKVIQLLGATAPIQKKIIDAIFGGKFNATAIFGAEAYPKEDIKGFYLSDDLELAEDIALIKNNPDDYEIVLLLKEIYDWYVLKDLLKGEKDLSNAMVNIYNKHKSDLRLLKKYVKTYLPKDYDAVFGYTPKSGEEKKAKVGLYTQYISGGRFGDAKLGHNGRVGEGNLQREDFYKGLKKLVEKAAVVNGGEEIKAQILADIDNDNFLPKIVSKNNSAIPYQLNMMELKKILEVAAASPKYAFLLNEENGWTNIAKIESLLWFRIPYYVGPIKNYAGSKPSDFAWAVRKTDGRVTPWTFDSVINGEASNVKFIDRMTTCCTYLKNAKSLPKASILFSKFACLNELNNLKINGEAIDVKLKQGIFDAVYLTGKPTIKKIVNYLVNICGYDKCIVLSGIDSELKSTMHSYLLYKGVLGDFVDNEPELMEQIVKLSTIHNNAKMLENSIADLVNDKLTKDQIKSIKGYMFNGWGNLSAELLDGYRYNGLKTCYDGELLSIIDIMYATNYNLQQIIALPNCNFKEALDKYNEENGIVEDNIITYDTIDDTYCSPSVKKQVWQAFLLVKDIVKQSKCIPDKVFLESCREHTDKKKNVRTKTRREQILELYKNAKNLSEELNEDMRKCMKQLDGFSDMQLNGEKLFLYFMQLGRCMYTGESIDLGDLANVHSYDVDHIIPRAKIKDDSLTNKVLVVQRANKEKGDQYPVPVQFRQYALWKTLRHAGAKMGLISDEKYARLIRKSEITPEEQDKFINRQLVETNQTVLIMRDILERYFKGITDKKVEIVLSKAGNVSDFRKEYGLTKSREVNDFHHACDAYLNIVVGDILNKQYNHNWIRTNSNGIDKSYNFANTLRNKVYANGGAILNTIKQQLSTKDFRMVSLPYTQKGQLYKETLFCADNNPALIPICESKIVNGIETHPKCDTAKYGGYRTSGTAYFVVVDSKDKKGKVMRSIEAISVFDDARVKNKKTTIEKVLEESGLINPKLAKVDGLETSIIKTGTLMDFGGYKLRLSGIGSSQVQFHNANQLFVTDAINRYVKEVSVIIDKANKIAKIVDNNKEEALNSAATELILQNVKRKEEKKADDVVIITEQQNMSLFDFYVDKLSHNPYKNIPTYSSLLTVLKGGRDDFASKCIYGQLVLLNNIIKAFQCNARLVDASALKYEKQVKGEEVVAYGKPQQCAICKSKIITGEDISVVLQSRSGLKQKKISLKS